MSDVAPVRHTGIGSWPGSDIADAVKIALELCPELPYLPELPARGPYAAMIGRSTAFLAGLSVDLQPAGWRLADASSREHRLAVSTLRADLDHLEEQVQGYAGPLKVAVAGPWTLAASMERPRGDRVLADSGARRDLAQSLAEGAAELMAEIRRRLPAIEPILQLDEPSLPAVLAGGVPTASGLSRHRAVDLPEVSGAISQIVHRLAEVARTTVVIHCCAANPPVDLLRGARVGGLLLDAELLTTAEWDQVGVALEAGLWLGLGVLPTRPGSAAANPDQLARRALRIVEQLGLDQRVSGQLVLTPACGLAGASRAYAIAALRALGSAAAIVTDQLGGS